MNILDEYLYEQSIIYKATNILTNKVYIGQTWRSLQGRIKAHHRVCLKSLIKKPKNQSYFHNALMKYGFDKFTWDILCKCNTQLELDKKEKEYIKKFNSTNKTFGYNLKEGGSNGKFNLEARKNLSLGLINYFKSDKARKKQGKSQNKRFNKIEERIKHSKCHGGKAFYARNVNELKKFKTQYEASIYTKVSQRFISCILHGKVKSKNNWIFSFKYITKKMYDDFVEQLKRKIFFAVKNGQKLEFSNKKQAAKQLNTYPSNIITVLKGTRKSANGWFFYYKFEK